jgi:hypothetical protein
LDNPTRALIIALATAVATSTCSANRSTPSHPYSKTSISRVLKADSTLDSLRPVQRIVVSVQATATQDPKTRLWTYAYSLSNDAKSRNALETFAVRPVRKPIQVVSPPHWMGSFGSEGDSTAVAWSVVDAGPEPLGWNGAQLYLGPYHPQPGSTVAGFAIVSRQGPTELQFFAQGFDTLQTGGEEDVESSPTMFEEGVCGETIGPGP